MLGSESFLLVDLVVGRTAYLCALPLSDAGLEREETSPCRDQVEHLHALESARVQLFLQGNGRRCGYTALTVKSRLLL